MSRHTNENRKKARKVATLERIEKRYLVFSEGEETEPHYFKGFKRAIESNPIYKNSVQLIPIGTGRETINVLCMELLELSIMSSITESLHPIFSLAILKFKLDM